MVARAARSLLVGAAAVAATLPGLGRLVLAVAAPLAREVQVGPPPAEDLLEKVRFIWPSAKDGVVSLTSSQLACLLDGIDWRNPQYSCRPQSAG